MEDELNSWWCHEIDVKFLEDNGEHAMIFETKNGTETAELLHTMELTGTRPIVTWFACACAHGPDVINVPISSSFVVTELCDVVFLLVTSENTLPSGGMEPPTPLQNSCWSLDKEQEHDKENQWQSEPAKQRLVLG